MIFLQNEPNISDYNIPVGSVYYLVFNTLSAESERNCRNAKKYFPPKLRKSAFYGPPSNCLSLHQSKTEWKLNKRDRILEDKKENAEVFNDFLSPVGLIHSLVPIVLKIMKINRVTESQSYRHP